MCFLAKKKKNWDDEYDMMGYNLGKYTGNNFAYKKSRDSKTKVREKKVVVLSGFFRSSGEEGCQSYYCPNGFQLLGLERGFLCCKVS